MVRTTERMTERTMGAKLIRCVMLLWLILAAIWTPPVAASTHVHWLNRPPARSAFRQAMQPQDWHFPEDLGSHPDYQTEWWYYTGNLATETGRPFGFQLTFFRQALTAAPVPSPSRWRSHQVYSAHFTVSDIGDRHFYPYERFSRDNLGMAGAMGDPYQVWLQDWSATEIAPGQVRLQARGEDTALDVVVRQTLPPILQGDRGFSVKGEEPGNASYYYSLVQQPTVGTITIQGQPYSVQGLTWKDHEYSTSALSPGTLGWDWFSMQFDNGTALMLYLLRREDGSFAPASAGTFIAADGTSHPLKAGDWTVTTLDTWTSPTSKAVYPAKWAIAVPRFGLELQGRSLLGDQELHTTTATYWEGAVAFQGTLQAQAIGGQGYVELTGYADRLDRLLAEGTP